MIITSDNVYGCVAMAIELMRYHGDRLFAIRRGQLRRQILRHKTGHL